MRVIQSGRNGKGDFVMNVHIVERIGSSDPFEADKQAVRSGLVAYNNRFIPEELMHFQEIGFFAKDEAGNVLGGIYGAHKFDYIDVSIFWLDESLRKMGIGSMLIGRMEEKARELGCKLIKLDTFSFQARGFYEKNGFTVFGQVDDIAGGHTVFYLLKRL